MRIRIIASIAVILALCVVMLGAYTRLTDAGLGCPDWPGCYGHLVLPSANVALENAQANFPTIPIEKSKAWTEMAHRYLAGTLGLLIFIMGFWTLRKKAKMPWHLPVFLMILVIFQALLGMWTVTLKLLPIVVMAHLLGGMLIFATLVRFRLQLSMIKSNPDYEWRFWIQIGLLIVFLQIALGGWVSANYAGIACIGFPQCNGLWMPSLHLAKGFALFSSLGANYQGGLLDSDVRMTIQFIHRLGALVTAIYLFSLSSCLLLFSKQPALRIIASLAMVLLGIQLTLGIINVMYLLPLPIAVAHNGVAALLLASVFAMLHFTPKKESYAIKN